MSESTDDEFAGELAGLIQVATAVTATAELHVAGGEVQKKVVVRETVKRLFERDPGLLSFPRKELRDPVKFTLDQQCKHGIRGVAAEAARWLKRELARLN